MKASFFLHPISALQQHWVVNSVYEMIQATKRVFCESVEKIKCGYECASKMMYEKYQIEHKTEAVGSAKIWLMLSAIYLLLKSVVKTIQLSFLGVKGCNETKAHHELEYSHKNKVYKILLTDSTTSVTHIKQCVSAKAAIKQGEEVKEEDVTEQVVKLLGPYENWHHQSYTPATFGWESLTLFKLCDETFDTIEHTFEANDKLIKVSEIKNGKQD